MRVVYSPKDPTDNAFTSIVQYGMERNGCEILGMDEFFTRDDDEPMPVFSTGRMRSIRETPFSAFVSSSNSGCSSGASSLRAAGSSTSSTTASPMTLSVSRTCSTPLSCEGRFARRHGVSWCFAMRPNPRSRTN